MLLQDKLGFHKQNPQKETAIETCIVTNKYIRLIKISYTLIYWKHSNFLGKRKTRYQQSMSRIERK